MRVKILCADGTHWVRVFRDVTLDATATSARCWETFEMEQFPDGQITLRTLARHPRAYQYVRAVGGGGAILSADRDEARGHEMFTRVPLGDGRCAIKTASGHFWRAKGLGGGELDCHALVQDAWEVFTIQTV